MGCSTYSTLRKRSIPDEGFSRPPLRFSGPGRGSTFDKMDDRSPNHPQLARLNLQYRTLQPQLKNLDIAHWSGRETPAIPASAMHSSLSG